LGLAIVSPPPPPPTANPPHFYICNSFLGNPEILYNLATLHRGSLFPGGSSIKDKILPYKCHRFVLCAIFHQVTKSKKKI
jgi:hypothetical protein